MAWKVGGTGEARKLRIISTPGSRAEDVVLSERDS